MLHRLYQCTLVALQLALLALLAPPLAQALQRGLSVSTFAGSTLGALQIGAALLAIGAGAVALVFPLLALLRHRQRGRARFGGLPRWAVALALAGALVFAVGACLRGIVPLVDADSAMVMLLTARPLLNAGLAAMAAGVLCAELLRRSVGMPRVIMIPGNATPERIEVTHPPELATHVA